MKQGLPKYRASETWPEVVAIQLSRPSQHFSPPNALRDLPRGTTDLLRSGVHGLPKEKELSPGDRYSQGGQFTLWQPF